MASQVKTGLGTQVFITRLTSGSTRTKLAEIKDIEWPDSVADEIDVSNMDSGRDKEFIAGMNDNGETTIPMNYVPGSPTDVLLTEIKATGETVEIEYVLPGELTGDKYFAFCKGYKRSTPMNEAMTAEATFRISGLVE